MRFPFVRFLLFVLFLFSIDFQTSGLSSRPTRQIAQPAAGFLCAFPFRKQQLSYIMDSSTGSIVQSTSFGTTTSTSGSCTGSVGQTAATTSSTSSSAAAAAAAAATIIAVPSASSVSPLRLGGTTPIGPASSGTSASSTTASSSLIVGGTAAGITMPNLSTSNSCLQQHQQQIHQQTSSLIIESMKSDDFNNVSLASAVSEGQRSLSGAPSASSSPLLSPPGKIFGRNANGTMIATSRPGNEAEVQLYRVLQRASLLTYYDTLLEMGGDDVQQLYEAGEEEFLEIMALVGMASKPLHVRRLQKALHEWANNPALFQGPLISTATGMCETPTKSSLAFSSETSPAIFARIKKLSTFNPTPVFNPTPLLSTAAQTQSSSGSAVHLLTHAPCSPAVSVPVIQPQSTMLGSSMPLPSAATAAAAAALAASTLVAHQPSGSSGQVAAAHQVSSSSPQLTPVLTELQVTRITLGAEKIANQLPQREPRAQTSKKRTSRELEQVIAMNENDPRRMEEIRKYSAIYGRFDCKRRPEKPLTLHEVCVNEAAAQLCRLVPALLTRRDELFPLARQIVKDAGFGHSASIARYGGLLPQISVQASTAAAASSSSSSSITALNVQRSSMLVDCESSDSSMSSKRQRLSSTETKPTLEFNRELNEDSRYNLFAMYQKFAKPPFDLSDIAKFSLGKTDFDDNANDNENDNDNDNDNDSRFSFSNSSNSPSSMPHNGNGESTRELVIENTKFALSTGSMPRCHENVVDTDNSGTADVAISSIPSLCNRGERQINLFMAENVFPPSNSSIQQTRANENSPPTTSFGGVQVISAAAAGHIIAVANPALVMSPALKESAAMSLKREADTPDD